MEDLAPVFIALAVIGIASYLSLKNARKRKAAGLPTAPPVRRRPYRFLFRRNGKFVIPKITIGISFFLVASYFTIASRPDPKDLFIKELQARHLFENPVNAAIAACGAVSESLFCQKNLPQLLELQTKLKEDHSVDQKDFKLMAQALTFYGNWSKEHVALNLGYEQKLNDDLDKYHELMKTIQTADDRTLAKENFSLKTLFFSQISHADLSHLFNNVFALLFFGSVVEGWLGSALYLLTYVLGGTLAMIAYVQFFAAPDVHVLGASANISSIIAGYAFFRIKDGFNQFKNSSQSIAMAFYFFYYLFGSDVAGVARGAKGIAFGAHLLGAISGLLILLVAGTPPTDDDSLPTQKPDTPSTPTQSPNPIRDFRTPS